MIKKYDYYCLSNSHNLVTLDHRLAVSEFNQWNGTVLNIEAI